MASRGGIRRQTLVKCKECGKDIWRKLQKNDKKEGLCKQCHVRLAKERFMGGFCPSEVWQAMREENAQYSPETDLLEEVWYYRRYGGL